MNVKHPKGSCLSLTSICLENDIFFSDDADGEVIKLAPKVLIVVFDEDKVVSLLSVTIVDTDRVQNVCVLFLVKLVEYVLNVVLLSNNSFFFLMVRAF